MLRLQQGILATVVLFWATMNVLLWRAEVGAGARGGSPVSWDVVVDKVLTAPDPSTLELLHHGRRIGYCHWFPDTGGEPPGATKLSVDYVPEGMVRESHGYLLKMDGQFEIEELDLRPRFSAELSLAPDRTWKEFVLNISLRPTLLSLRGHADRQELTWSYQDGTSSRSNTLSLAQLRDPQALLRSLGTPWAALLSASLPPGVASPQSHPAQFGLEWRARTDWIGVGHSRLRGYRMEARLFDRHSLVIRVNRAGEILRVELPNGIVLVNEELTSL
jgi:hypothetical protein